MGLGLSGLRLGLGQRGGGGSAQWTPESLFSASEDGAWYDPSDFSTLWQDAAGTVAVTATGQTVKRIDDKSGNGNNASNASSAWTLEQDVFGNYYLETDGTTMLTTGTVYASMAAWPSVAAAFRGGDNPTSAAYPFSVVLAGQDRHISIQQGTSANNRAGLWKRNATQNPLQVITDFYRGTLNVVSSINGGTNTTTVNGQDHSTTDAATAPTTGDYSISLGGQNDITPNIEVCRIFGAVTVGRQLTTDEASNLSNYLDAKSPVGNLRSASVFLNIGQSNMIGRDNTDGTLHASNTAQWDPDDGDIAASSPLAHVNPLAGDIGPDVTFSIDFAAAGGGDLVFIPHAQGGTSFTGNFWNKGNTLYEDAVESANRFYTMYQNPIAAILWHQGESDEGNAGYETALDTFIGDIRTDLTGATSTTPFILGGLVPTFVDNNANTAAIQATIEDTPNRVSNTYYVSSTGLTDLGDELHFSTASTKTLGGRYYAAYAAT